MAIKPFNYLLLASMVAFPSPTLSQAQSSAPQQASDPAISAASTISGYVLGPEAANRLLAASPLEFTDIALDLHRSGEMDLLYSQAMTVPVGEIGRSGVFEQRLSTTFDKQGRELSRETSPLPLGLVASWERSFSGYNIRVGYYEEGSRVRVGTEKLPTYVKSEIGPIYIGNLDRPQIVLLAYPEASERSGSYGLFVINQGDLGLVEALAIATVSAHYIRYPS